MNTNVMGTVFLIVVVVGLALIFVPLALIWALNTLFPALLIPYTWSTWFAMLLITGVLSARAST